MSILVCMESPQGPGFGYPSVQLVPCSPCKIDRGDALGATRYPYPLSGFVRCLQLLCRHWLYKSGLGSVARVDAYWLAIASFGPHAGAALPASSRKQAHTGCSRRTITRTASVCSHRCGVTHTRTVPALAGNPGIPGSPWPRPAGPTARRVEMGRAGARDGAGRFPEYRAGKFSQCYSASSILLSARMHSFPSLG